MGIISIKNLVHRFSKYGDNGEEIGEKTALEQVSLDIEKGRNFSRVKNILPICR